VSLRGAIEDVRIESVPVAPAEGGLVGATGTGIATECPASGAPPELEDVAVDGGRSLTKGIEVAGGACGASLSRVEVSRIAGTALEVVADASVAVTVRGSTFRDSGVGIRATGGKLTVEPCEGTPSEVSGNAGDGIVVAGGMTKTLDVTIAGTQVRENGGTGIVLETVGVQSRLDITGCEIVGNGTVAPRTYGLDGTIRAAGGLLLLQNDGMLAFSFMGNRVFLNGGDEIGVWSDAPWSLSPGSCGGGSNAIGCAGTDAYGISVVGNASVDATYNVWSSSQPSALVNGATWNPACPASVGGTPAALVCPAP
jgi:hypothetical protein